MVPAACSCHEGLSVTCWQFFGLFQLFKLFKLFKLLVEYVLGEFFSHWTFGLSHHESHDNRHAFPAFR